MRDTGNTNNFTRKLKLKLRSKKYLWTSDT